jgi:tRNA threonylcarbamoyladenosine biosynthesis protein TsaE
MPAPDTDALVWADLADTEAAGRALAALLAAGDVIALGGDLGAGKTALVQALARGLGLPSEVRVTSPTFTLVHEYVGGRLPIHHADLYRIERPRELEEIGLDEIWRRGEGVLAIEWWERLPAPPSDALFVELAVTGPTSRRVTVRGSGQRGLALAAAWGPRPPQPPPPPQRK